MRKIKKRKKGVLIMLIGMIVAIALLMYGAMKGYSIAVLAPITALLAAATSGENLLSMYIVNYMTAVGNYVTNWFPMFLMGALFGEVMKESGAAASIARKLISVFGEKRIILAMLVPIIVLVVGGVSVFCIVFVIYPLMLMCFKEANLPKYLMPGVLIAGVIISESSVPGNPQIQNIIPTQMLGVSPMAAPFMGFSAFAFMFVLVYVYLIWEVKRAKEKGIGFVDDRGELQNINSDQDLPNFVISLLPIIAIIVTLNVIGLNVIVAMLIGIILTIVLFFNRLKDKLLAVINRGCLNSYPAIMNTATAVGFGGVIQELPGFDHMVAGLNKMVRGNTYLFAFIAVNILAGIAGSASGGMTIALNAVGKQMLATGVNPEALARVVAIASVGLDSLPHNGAIITMLTYCGVTHKEGYKPMFVVSVLVPIIAGIYAVVMANLFY